MERREGKLLTTSDMVERVIKEKTRGAACRYVQLPGVADHVWPGASAGGERQTRDEMRFVSHGAALKAHLLLSLPMSVSPDLPCARRPLKLSLISSCFSSQRQRGKTPSPSSWAPSARTSKPWEQLPSAHLYGWCEGENQRPAEWRPERSAWAGAAPLRKPGVARDRTQRSKPQHTQWRN